MRTSFTLASLALIAMIAGVGVASAQSPGATDSVVAVTKKIDVQSSWYGAEYALDGQDVVSFHSADGVEEGRDDITAEWDNTVWKFASEDNRDRFLEDPDQYVPQFGGYCPVGLANGEVKIGSAKHFALVDDELYLMQDAKAFNKFSSTPDGYIAAAKINF